MPMITILLSEKLHSRLKKSKINMTEVCRSALKRATGNFEDEDAVLQRRDELEAQLNKLSPEIEAIESKKLAEAQEAESVRLEKERHERILAEAETRKQEARVRIKELSILEAEAVSSDNWESGKKYNAEIRALKREHGL